METLTVAVIIQVSLLGMKEFCESNDGHASQLRAVIIAQSWAVPSPPESQMTCDEFRLSYPPESMSLAEFSMYTQNKKLYPVPINLDLIPFTAFVCAFSQTSLSNANK